MTVISDQMIDHFMQGVDDIIGDMFSVKHPKTGETIQFYLKPNQKTYRYFKGPHGEMYCYSPHPDTNGNYWCWTYQPKGQGSRSGNAKRFRLIDLVRCAKLKTARSKALRRYQSAVGEVE